VYSDAVANIYSAFEITNPSLLKRVSAFGRGLIGAAGLVPDDSNVLLLLNDGLG
jgi:long-chain acyl-CoA synthetase